MDSLALANKQLELQAAFRNHFNKKRKKRTGFPKFKSAKHSRKAYTTNNQHGTVAILKDGYIRIPKAGLVRAVLHRLPDPEWKLRSATVSQERDGSYHISVLFEYEKEILPVTDPKRVIGLDYASGGLYVDDAGTRGTNHRYFREGQKKLARAQRKLSRRQGSKKNEEKSANFRKQLQKVNRICRHIANQRSDNLHKISTGIANRYEIVCVEDLDMRAMSNKKSRNGRSVMDNGYGMFLNMLEYKLRERGGALVRVGKWFPSSQLRHNCGRKHPEMKDLSRRVMRCSCGLTMDRDRNAAVNIRMEGMRIWYAARA